MIVPMGVQMGVHKAIVVQKEWLQPINFVTRYDKNNSKSLLGALSH